MSKGYKGIRSRGKYKEDEYRKGGKGISTKILFRNQFEVDGRMKNPIKVKDNKTIINDINNQIKELW